MNWPQQVLAQALGSPPITHLLPNAGLISQPGTRMTNSFSSWDEGSGKHIANFAIGHFVFAKTRRADKGESN